LHQIVGKAVVIVDHQKHKEPIPLIIKGTRPVTSIWYPEKYPVFSTVLVKEYRLGAGILRQIHSSPPGLHPLQAWPIPPVYRLGKPSSTKLQQTARMPHSGAAVGYPTQAPTTPLSF
jgi:hypothetical protein